MSVDFRLYHSRIFFLISYKMYDNNVIDNNKYNWYVAVVSFILLCSSQIYITWHLSIWNYLYLICILSCIFLSILLSKIEKANYLHFFLFEILFVWYSTIHNASIAGIIFNMSIPLILLISKELRIRILELIILKILPVFLAISVITYLLVSLNVIALPQFFIPPLNSLKNYAYISHIFFIVPTNYWDIGRFHAFYDEPGVVGSIAGLILCLYGKKMSKAIMMIYLLSGLLSMSFFFIIITLLGFFTGMISTKIKDILKIILIVLPLILLILNLYDNDYLQTRVFDRFTLDETGNVRGNTRNNEEFEYYFYNTFIHNTTDFLYGSKSNLYLTDGGSSIHNAIFRNGFILVLLTILTYVSFFCRKIKRKKEAILFCVIFFCMIYQRPELYSLFYFLLFTTISESNKFTYINISRCNI